MIFYFTGTGNSLYAAKRLDENCVSIPQVIHDRDKSYQDETIGIVAPVYGHELPEMVKSFLAEAHFDTQYLYVIATYGSGHSGAGAWIADLLAESGKQANYINTVLMVDNYLPSFDMDVETLVKTDAMIEQQLDAIKTDIAKRKNWIQPAGFAERLMHRQAIAMKHRIVTPAFLHDLYTVTDRCVGCEVCAQACPGGCFSVVDGRAVQNAETCQLCMACIHACPQKAIRLNIPERNPNARFRNEHIRLSEIIEANRQEPA